MTNKAAVIVVDGVSGVVPGAGTFEAEVLIAKEGLWIRPLVSPPKEIIRHRVKVITTPTELTPDTNKQKKTKTVSMAEEKLSDGWHFSPWDEVWFGSRAVSDTPKSQQK